VIGYYVHHHGHGHLHRAQVIAAACRTEVIGFSGLPKPEGWTGRWVELPSDAGGVHADVTAHGTLHWVPRHHPGLAARTGLISAELASGRVRLMVVDVSVEVSVLARLHGVPVVVVAQPGDRTDRPHRTAYDLAERLLAPWPPRPAPDWPAAWTAKTVHLGAVSRFDGRDPVAEPAGRRVLALWGSGGLDVDAATLTATAAACPRWRWQVVGPPPPDRGPADLDWAGWVEDVWPLLGAADVVVTHAGQNALAEVAAARRPAVVIPQHRPHGEQLATADALRKAGISRVAQSWPDPAWWPALLDDAVRQGGAGWRQWSYGDGAARAAAVLDDLASAA
jgi:predicted glycosyltransferase